jgi:NAD(P)-dependent dehydrogenase (short-subunit alcohol dehydrogenase family)
LRSNGKDFELIRLTKRGTHLRRGAYNDYHLISRKTRLTQKEGADMGKLDGKVVVITGATSGIGAESARLFVEEGARLVVGGRRGHLAQQLASELGSAVVPCQMDVSNESDIAAAVDIAVHHFGRLDCLFNNAGSAGVLGPIDETPAEALDATISVLFRSVVLGIKHAARVMKAQGSGTIISTASVAGFFTGYAPHVYSACKAAVIQLTRSAATELGEQGIRVNCICPGPVATPIFGSAFGLSDERAEELAQKLKSVFQTVQPIRRAGESIDVARAAVWLASDDSAFVNGHAMVVDGGLSLGQSWSGMQVYFGRLLSLAPRT